MRFFSNNKLSFEGEVCGGNKDDFFLHPRISFSPPKNPILPLILPPKSSVFIYRTFFKGINMCFQPFKTSVRIYQSFFSGVKRETQGVKKRHGGWRKKSSEINPYGFSKP
jgi:hypothetical protein